MILADTSIWVDHFRQPNPRLIGALRQSEVLMHSFVIGELTLGGVHSRTPAGRLLRNLPRARLALDDEVTLMIESHSLMNSGIGYVDAHLLASALISGDTTLWTLDRKLRDAARRLSVATDGSG